MNGATNVFGNVFNYNADDAVFGLAFGLFANTATPKASFTFRFRKRASTFRFGRGR